MTPTSFAFHPYLYHPTVAGLPSVAGRSVLHPAAHDEAPIRLPIYREIFLGAAGLAYWSDAEQRLTERLFPVAARRGIVVGLGVDARPGDGAAARATCGLGDRPFLLCLGRVDDGKGAQVLAACFARYKERHPGPLALVFAGPVVNAPPAHPDVIVTGAVDEDVKWGLLRAAQVLVSASAYESFSIVLLEGWSVGTPAFVNGWCEVTREHAAPFGRGSRVPFVSRVRGRVGTAARVRNDPRHDGRRGSRLRRGALPLAGSRRSLRRLPRRDR